MYPWKCWRDNRSRFILFLIAVSVVRFSITINLARGGTIVGRGGVVHLWSEMAWVILGTICSILTLLAALTLAVSSLGHEFKEQTMGFLLTRPRHRRYWIWTCWGVGVCELWGIVFLPVLATFAALRFLPGYVYTWRVLAAILPMFVGAVAVYGLTYLLTVVFRSGEQGISYGLGLVAVDLLLPMVMLNWHFHLSSVMSFMIDGCAWATSPTLAFPIGKLVIYTVVALAFPLAAQLVLECAEV